MTLEQKSDYVTATLIPMLRNDLRIVTEARCPKHGHAASGPNFTACYLCLSACEVVGALSAGPGQKEFWATRDFICRVGALANSSRYADVAGPLFAFFRHGIAHTFLPKHHGGITGAVLWMNDVCVDDLADVSKRNTLRQQHLQVLRRPSGNFFQVLPQVLFVDVDDAIVNFSERLLNGDFDQALFEENFNRWEADNQRLDKKFITSSERAALGIIDSGGL